MTTYLTESPLNSLGYVKRMSTLEMLVASLRQSGVVIADFISEATRERIVEGSRHPDRASPSAPRGEGAVGTPRNAYDFVRQKISPRRSLFFAPKTKKMLGN